MSRRRRRARTDPQLPELSGRQFPERDNAEAWPGEPSFVGSTEGAPAPRYSRIPLRRVWERAAPMQVPPSFSRSSLLRALPGRKLVAVNPAPASYRFDRFTGSPSFNALRIKEPEAVRFCVQRKVRRGVLFARDVAGRRHSAPGRGGKYRRSVHSLWSC